MSSHLKGPSEGDWSVFAEKVVKERDEARASDAESLAMYRRARERAEHAEAELGALRQAVQDALPLDMTGWGTLLESVPKMGLRLAKAEADLAQLMVEAYKEHEDALCLELALKNLVRVVSNRLTRGEEEEPGEFERAWEAACALIRKGTP